MFHNLPDFDLIRRLNLMERHGGIREEAFIYATLEKELESRIPQSDNQIYLGEYDEEILIITQPRK